jgi:hypothetical protein
MRKTPLAKMTTDELLARFVELVVKQGEALEMLETAAFNRLYPKVAAIVEELENRPCNQRRALLRLYNHANTQVRLTAAQYTSKLAPEAAMRVLEDIVKAKIFPQALHAGMSLAILRGELLGPK